MSSLDWTVLINVYTRGVEDTTLFGVMDLRVLLAPDCIDVQGTPIQLDKNLTMRRSK